MSSWQYTIFTSHTDIHRRALLRCEIASSHIGGKSRNGGKRLNFLFADEADRYLATDDCPGTGIDVSMTDERMMIQVYTSWLIPHLTPRKVRLALLTLATFAALC